MRATISPPLLRASRAGALVAAALLSLAQPATAQDPARDAAIAVRATYLKDVESLQSKFLQLAEAIPAEKYSWRPAPGVRSIGEVLMHVASEYYVWQPRTFTAEPSPVVGTGRDAFEKFEANATKENVLKHLKEGYAYGKQAVEAVDPAALVGTRKYFGRDVTTVQTAFFMSGDLHEHLGQLIAYARANGIKPPWSR
jgi:uncharacterized damage-inducible protein DinB